MLSRLYCTCFIIWLTRFCLQALGQVTTARHALSFPFSVLIMPKRKRRAADQEAESASTEKLSKEEAFFRKLQYTRDAVNSRDRFARGAVLDEDLEGAIAWISSQAPHEVRCNSSRAPFLFALVIHICGAGQCDKNHDHGRYRGRSERLY